jgi:hypothetical protein
MKAYLAGAGFTLLDEDREETVDEYFEDANFVSTSVDLIQTNHELNQSKY